MGETLMTVSEMGMTPMTVSEMGMTVSEIDELSMYLISKIMVLAECSQGSRT